MTKVTEVEGIGEVYGNKLSDDGINTQEKLLEHCATPKERCRRNAV